MVIPSLGLRAQNLGFEVFTAQIWPNISLYLVLTMQEAVIFEAPPTEQCMKGVHGLFSWHRLSIVTVYTGRTLRGQGPRVLGL